MNAEYQRLKAEASTVENQMRDLAGAVDLHLGLGVVGIEQQIGDLGRKMDSLRLGMTLIRNVNSLEMAKRKKSSSKPSRQSLVLRRHER